MRELIEADIAVGAFKMTGASVNIKGEFGGYVGTNLTQEDIIDYVCMSIGGVNKKIPMDFKDDFDGEINLNEKFHNTTSKVRKQYRDRVELERNIRISKISMWFGIVGFTISLIGLGLTIYTMVK